MMTKGEFFNTAKKGPSHAQEQGIASEAKRRMLIPIESKDPLHGLISGPPLTFEVDTGLFLEIVSNAGNQGVG